MNWEEIIIIVSAVASIFAIIEFIRIVVERLPKKPRLYFVGNSFEYIDKDHPVFNYIKVNTHVTNIGDANSFFLIEVKLKIKEGKNSQIFETHGSKKIIESKKTTLEQFHFKIPKSQQSSKRMKVKYTYHFILNGKKIKSSCWIKLCEDI